MYTPQIFLSNVAVIDHTYIDNQGNIRGGSYNPTFILSGSNNNDEQVVLDFEKGRNLITSHLNNKKDGFNHKLWIIEKFSKCNYVIKNNRIVVETDFAVMKGPENMVKIIPYMENVFYGEDDEQIAVCATNIGLTKYIGHAFEQFVQQKMGRKQISVECRNNTDIQAPFAGSTGRYIIQPFRYIHGLKNSSSWGCQNICHGHFGFIAFKPDYSSPTIKQQEQLIQSIVDELNNSILINRQTIVDETNSNYIEVAYTTPNRGEFSAKYFRSYNQFVIFPEEPTIENIAQYVFQEYGQSLKNYNITEVYISEGLSEGAFISIK